MQHFVIQGGYPLSGEMTASGNKNAATKMLPACMLTDEPVILHNVPNIGDVRRVRNCSKMAVPSLAVEEALSSSCRRSARTKTRT